MTRRTPSEADVLALVRREVAESRYGYAPGRVSLGALQAGLTIAGFRRGAATEAALRRALARLVETGKVRAAEVVGPSGQADPDWYEPVVD